MDLQEIYDRIIEENNEVIIEFEIKLKKIKKEKIYKTLILLVLVIVKPEQYILINILWLIILFNGISLTLK